MTTSSTTKPARSSRVCSKGKASRLASEGNFAIGVGQTSLAAEKYEEAGQTLERDVSAARISEEKHMLMFLAATQFYLGGKYGKAQQLANHIEARLLPPSNREMFARFVLDVRTRASDQYILKMRKAIARLYLTKQQGKALQILKDHPFIYDQNNLAFSRAVMCEDIGEWKAAAAFYSMAFPEAAKHSDFMLMAAGRALGLPSENRTDEAWDYISTLHQLRPEVSTAIAASVICFFKPHRSRMQKIARFGRYDKCNTSTKGGVSTGRWAL